MGTTCAARPARVARREIAWGGGGRAERERRATRDCGRADRSQRAIGQARHAFARLSLGSASDFVVIEILEVAFRPLPLHELLEPAFRGLLATGTRNSVDLELMNELFDVDLDRRVADVVGFRCRFACFLFGLLVVLFLEDLFLFFFFLVRLL